MKEPKWIPFRSNPGCPVCASPIRQEIDKLLSKAYHEDSLLFELDDMVQHEILKHPEHEETLKPLLSISREAIAAHEMAHRRFSKRQQYQQPDLADGDVLDGVDLSQAVEHTEVARGVQGLTLIRCRLENCDLPEDVSLVECEPIYKSYCSHLNPRMPIPQCETKCKHVMDYKAEVVVEGRVVLRDVYRYRNLIVTDE